MFYKKRIAYLESRIDNLRDDYKRVSDHCWTLQGRIDRILEHLKVHEVTINKTVLRSKDGPEQGE